MLPTTSRLRLFKKKPSTSGSLGLTLRNRKLQVQLSLLKLDLPILRVSFVSTDVLQCTESRAWGTRYQEPWAFLLKMLVAASSPLDNPSSRAHSLNLPGESTSATSTAPIPINSLDATPASSTLQPIEHKFRATCLQVAFQSATSPVNDPKLELIILALSENKDLSKYPIFAQNWACVGASCLDHLFLPIFP